MELLVSTGNFGLLAQYGIDWEGQKPLSRLKEAIHVMRTFLDEGAITFEGDFFRYNGLYTFARPVQERIPIKMGAMKGPRSFETAIRWFKRYNKAGQTMVLRTGQTLVSRAVARETINCPH